MAYNDRPEFPDVAAVLQAQLGELGVEVKIRAGGVRVAGAGPAFRATSTPPCSPAATLVDVADPGGYLLSDWTCDGGYNIAHYCDPETDQLIQDAVAIENLDERNAAYQELATELQSEASVFLRHEGAVWGTEADVANFTARTRWTTTSSPPTSPSAATDKETWNR